MMLPVLLSMFIPAAVPDLGLRVRASSDPLRVEVTVPIPAKHQGEVPAGRLTQAQGERWLRLTLVDGESGREGDPIFGSYERRESALVFVPRFPLTHGQRYRATLEWTAGLRATADHQTPARPATQPTTVERIYPSGNEVPANLLKFYIHFSKPMRESKKIFDHLHILDTDGKPVHDPWRRTELWSADGKRLTLWIHPGRIKQGVNLREEFGPVLEPKRSYTLVIGPELLDAAGQPLGRAFTRAFRTLPEERTRLALEQWRIESPASGTTRPLMLRFPRPVDRALLDRFLTIVDGRDQAVAGRIEVGENERSWAFHPAKPWLAGAYRVKVDGQLEDLAGNTPLRVFDLDLDDPIPPEGRLVLPFQVKRNE